MEGMYFCEDTEHNTSGDYKLLSNESGFYNACLDVINSWPVSCLVNLSNTNHNRRAWLGRAACFLKTGSTEPRTRHSWSRLTLRQQRRANLAADRAIAVWEKTLGLATYQTQSAQLVFPFMKLPSAE